MSGALERRRRNHVCFATRAAGASEFKKGGVASFMKNADDSYCARIQLDDRPIDAVCASIIAGSGKGALETKCLTQVPSS